MNFLANKPAQKQGSQRHQLMEKYARSRHNLLLVVIFTVINVVLLVSNSNSYFLWSAYIPYLMADLGMLLSGSYPEELYTGEFAGMDFLGKGFLAVMLVVAGVILVLYLLSWILSKKNKVGWLVFALVMFILDTVWMFLLAGVSSILDIVFHAWVLIVLFMGVSAGYKLKKLPIEPEEDFFAEEEIVAEEEEVAAEEEEVAAEEPQAEE